MSLVKSVGKFLGGLLGAGVAGLFGKKPRTPIAPRPVTRDDAALEAARDLDRARRRGAAADRATGSGGEPAGGLGKLVIGS